MPEKDHGKAARELDEAAKGAKSDEARFYREAAKLVRDQKLQQAIKELEANPQARAEAKKNPKAFLKGKGLDLPDGFTVEVTD